ncbi:MAG: ThiF family adenylyltransferase [Planctomycetota bacterium]|nr:ThiF family adenylyltransferase [Planctomycetota bacterium]
MIVDRYARQLILREIGPEGQERLRKGRVLIAGCGALGTNAAQLLLRAGVGRLRIVDRDFVEQDNLHRQVLFDETDANERRPKAIAACSRLKQVNSQAELEPVVADMTPRTIEKLLTCVDVVVDATDNMETRFLLNDACVKNGVSWVYGGAVGTVGMTMTVVPGKTACLRCVMESPPAAGVLPTCETMGVLNAAPAAVAAFEAAEAMKVLVGRDKTGDTILYFDVWQRTMQSFAVARRADCPACGKGEYEFLAGAREGWVVCLCGRNAVQVTPADEAALDLARLKDALSPYGRAEFNGYLLSLKTDDKELVIFPDGRAIVKGTTDEALARTLYARYIGH